MNTYMYEHPITAQHLAILQEWGYRVIDPMEKKLACGDIGIGAMASVSSIVDIIEKIL